MKARIIKTGEILDVEPDNDNVYYDQKDCSYYPDEIDLECYNSPIDWEQRHYELAKAYSIEFIKLQHEAGRTECGILYHNVVLWSVELADALIAELKKGGNK